MKLPDNETLFWRALLLFALLSMGSCTVRSIYCDWRECKRAVVRIGTEP